MQALQLPTSSSRPISAFDLARVLILLDIVAITFSPALVNLIELLLIITVAMSSDLRKEIVYACQRYLPARFLLAFVLWVVVATTWGDAPVAERIQEITSWRKLLLFPLVLALVTDKFRKTMLTLIAAVGVLYAVAALIGGLSNDLKTQAVLMRSDVVQTIYLALSMLSTLTLLRLYRASISPWLWVFGVTAVGLFLVTIFTSTGRSGYLFCLVGISCFAFFFAERYRLMVVAGLSALAIVLLLVVPSPVQEIRNGLSEIVAVTDPAQDPEFSSMGIRVVMWDHTIEMIANKPIFGSGAGSFEIDYGKVAESRSVGWRSGRSNDPHQQFLHVAAEYGLVGLMLLVAFIGSLIYRLRIDSFSVFGLSILLGLCATSFFNGHLSSLVEGRIFWILVPLFLYPRSATLKPKLQVNR